ncbi:MAG: LysR family transcriptional regulator [Alphaproteobacteria bacterium]|jgi:DNA-binding transcriptional LysR family regulator|nr:LysR family transcriptional regulator [Alphaproteobacteria bacterium]
MSDRFLSIDWDDLKVFLAVSRSGSLRGAARMLGLNHATVNRRLKALEAGLGSKLFDRTPDGFVPTQAGDDLLTSAERVEDELFTAQRNIAGRDADLDGEVRVSLPFAIWRAFLAVELCRFARLYPGIDLDLDLTDRFSDLTRLEADVSIRMAHEVTDDVLGRRLAKYAKTLYAAPEVAAGAGSSWIGWHSGDGDQSWVRGTAYPGLPVRHNLPSHALQIEAARAGMGLTMLPCFLGDREPGLVRVPGALPIPDRSIWLLSHHGLRKTARVRAFVDYIADAILAHRALLEGRA